MHGSCPDGGEAVGTSTTLTKKAATHISEHLSSTIAPVFQRISRNGGQARSFLGVTHIEERFAQCARS